MDSLEKDSVAGKRKFRALAHWFWQKSGSIAVGNGRVECDWKLPNSYNTSNFAGGAKNKVLNVSEYLISPIE
ncbi:hypothetical protein [Neolewinella agarilytica]|uniref:Uncharacterized protein n=1 Tax=Neolewinella agarilytica TaxID=478744 RepID=A0A1H8ZG29_9BACT|nr:hypothetical protein [Neolewinella agarilytica]SEP63342.1 hypothetical protein SAMN05444359_101311 [Neolewinella agarilytica]